MVQILAAQSSNIIDLTEGDDADEDLDQLSSAASRAEAAASRLTNHLQSLTSTSKTSPYGASSGQNSSSGKPSRPATNGGGILPGKDRVSQTRRPLPDSSLRSVITGPRLGTFGLRGPSSHNESSMRMRYDRPATPAISKKSSEPNPSVVRSPRAAAQSAGRTIAKTYEVLNPLEAEREARINTPRKPGRPRMDQYTPNGQTSRYISKTESRNTGGRSSTTSPTPRLNRIPTTETRTSPLADIAGSGVILNRKRKHQSGSPDSDPSAKHIRHNVQNPAHESVSNNAASFDRSNTGRKPQAPRPSPSLAPGFEEHLEEKGIGNFRATSSPEQPQQWNPKDPVDAVAHANVFSRVIYPGIRAAKKKYEDRFTEERLAAIGKGVLKDIIDNGVDTFCPEAVQKPPDSQRTILKEKIFANFDEKASRVLRDSPMNLTDSASYPEYDMSIPLFKRDLTPSMGILKDIREQKGKNAPKDEQSLPPPMPAPVFPARAASTWTPQPMSETELSHCRKASNQETTARTREGIEGATDVPQAQTFAKNKDLANIFKTVVYPAIKKAKKRHSGHLTEDELDLIGKRVAADVVEQSLEISPTKDLSQPSDDQRKAIKRFVKRLFRRMVVNSSTLRSERSSATEGSHHQSCAGHVKLPGGLPSAGQNSNSIGGARSSTTPSTSTMAPSGLSVANSKAQSAKRTNLPESLRMLGNGTNSNSAIITDLPGYLCRLEEETHPADLDVFNFASSARAQVSTSIPSEKREQAIAEPILPRSNLSPMPPRLARADSIVYDSSKDQSNPLLAATGANVSRSAILGLESISSLETPFPPGFDRGRFPAQRRRRANKFYTPERPSATTGTQTLSPDPAAQVSRPAPIKKPNTLGAARLQISGSSIQTSQDLITQELIARVGSDPTLKALLEAVAAGNASSLQLKVLKDFTDQFSGISNTQEQKMPRTTTLPAGKEADLVDMEDSSDGSPHFTPSEDFRSISSGKKSTQHASKIPSTEKDQVRLLKSLANWSEDSGIRQKRPGGQKGNKNRQGGVQYLESQQQNSIPSIKETKAETARDKAVAEPTIMVGPPISAMPGRDLSPPASLLSSYTPTNLNSAQTGNNVGDSHWTGNNPETRLREMARSVVNPQVTGHLSIIRSPATALDPQLEHVVAVLIVNESAKSRPRRQKDRYFIDYTEQEELVEQQTLLKCADLAPKLREAQASEGPKPAFTRIETKVIDPARRPERHISSLLRHRELGSDSRGRNIETQTELRLRTSEMIEPWRYWKGASGDIVAATWGPDSTTYAVGAASHTNPEDVQYNRPCNLLLGDIHSNTLIELPDHRIDRPKPETLADTYNARQAVYDACDPMVYETVSSIAFAPIGDRMYTASHDHTVKIWDTSAVERRCLRTLYHGAKVTSVEVSPHRPGLFATGSEVIENSIRVYYAENPEDSNPLHVDFSSSRAQARPDWKIVPECLRWCSTAYNSHLLLAGFQQWEHDSNGPPPEGQLCLWDANAFQYIKVVPSSQSVLAAAWHPTLPFFATGGAPGGSLTDKYTTKTVVRTWDLRSPKHYSMEYECSALDMQDLTFHPSDSNIVTVGCTDGSSFVWDYRRPDYPLHRLRHGSPLVDWDHTRGRREEVDTGVMMSLWGLGGSLFYTGSSDGMIKAWDIRRHPQDVLVRNVAQFGAGIQSGAFSPDGTNLLVGDADGGVHVLSSAPCGTQPSEDGSSDVSPEVPITLIRAPSGSGLTLDAEDDDPGTEGRAAANELTKSGQLEYESDHGVTQGQRYCGPYATYLRGQALDPNVRRLQTETRADGIQGFLRTYEETNQVEDQRKGLIEARKQRISQLYPPSKAALEAPGKKSRSQFDGGVFNGPTSYSPMHTFSPLGADEGQSPPDTSRPASRDTSIISSSDKGDRNASSSNSPNRLTFARPPILDSSHDFVENVIPESKMVEENYWWPRLGEDEIAKARAGRGHENFAE